MKEWHIAKVIDNNHSSQDGRIQIYIPYLMDEFESSHYPWAKQCREFSSFIPENNEYVWVWFEDDNFKKQAYYGNKVTLKDYHDHNETIGSMTGSYPNIKYIKLNNGVSLALNSNETEASLKVGNAEIYINPSGQITIKGVIINITDITGTITFNLLTHTHATGVGPSGPPITGT